MARIMTTGFELNTTAGTEGFTVSGANPPTISTSIVRTGTNSLKQTGGTGSSLDWQFATANGNGPYFFRTYLWLDTMPGADGTFAPFFVSDIANATVNWAFIVNSTGTVTIHNGAGTNLGTSTLTLKTSQWYRCEMYGFNNTGTGFTDIALYVDGVQYTSTNANTETGGVGAVHFSNGGGDASVVAYFDDIAINDSTGSSQTG